MKFKFKKLNFLEAFNYQLNLLLFYFLGVLPKPLNATILPSSNL